MAVWQSFWKGRTYNLGKMGLGELVRAYFTYPTVLVYLALTAVGAALAALLAQSAWPLVATPVLIAALYPFIEYMLHRFVLHGRYLYRSSLTSATWKRIHFDHHQDPHDLRVLFGALYTTLPTIAVIALPLGWIVAGLAGACAAFASGTAIICIYEFCHCVQHLNHTPKSRYLQRIKRLHLAHHFHNETGNFGITSHLWDRVLGTLYETVRAVPHSKTVFNLGYTAAEAERYPWVADLSGGTRGDGNPRRFRRPGASDDRGATGLGAAPAGRSRS